MTACRRRRRVCFSLEQQLHAIRFVLVGSENQRSFAEFVAMVDVCAVVEQKRSTIGVAVGASPHQCRVSDGRSMVHRRFALDEEFHGVKLAPRASEEERSPA